MLYALNLATDKRIMSVTYDEFAPAEYPRVTALPSGDTYDYKYIDGEYVYDPLPKPTPTTGPTIAQNRADIDFLAMMADIEL